MSQYVLIIFLLLSVSTFSADPQTISSTEIAEDAIECDECVEWRVVGICFWLECHLFDCEVNESTKIGHYIPEVVVGTYSTYSPFSDMDFYGDTTLAAMSRTESTLDGETHINFKHAEILGNPATLFFSLLAETDWFCSPAATPFMPYFVDKFDPSWRSPSIEQLYPQSVLGFPKIKSAITTGYWAPEYPRCGWGSHPVDPINAAVAAQRSAEIATRDWQPHVYQTIPTGGCGGHCWPPEPLQVNNDHDNKFQFILPKKELFSGAIGGAASWANGNNKNAQTYVWNLWRYNECCKKEGQVFLFDVEFQ